MEGLSRRLLLLFLAFSALAAAPRALGDDLAVLAAGATESTVRDVVGTFEKETGQKVALSFGAVGRLRDRLQAGERADVVIVTPVIIEQLEARSLVRSGSRVDLGQVGGGIAVRAGAPRPPVGTADELKRALLVAEEVYYADPLTATAGAYLLKIADRLGVGDEVKRKGHVAPGGRAAMKALAQSKATAIGLTQVSEILSVPEVALIGPYPADLQSSTTYAGILPAGTTHPEAAAAFLRFLTGPLARTRFAKAGFEPTVAATKAEDPPAYGPELEGFDYAFPVQRFDLSSQRETLHMSYLDVAPEKPNGRTAVLLHGKNFCAGTWESTIRALAQAGYRVVAPDQIGFCKSSKPERYQYSFQQLAANTRALLDHLGVQHITLLGHSTGGMLAMRYALLYPQQMERLVLVNPIGLEDWKALGVPWRSVDEWYARELKTTAEGIRQYEQGTYYAGQWRPEYDRWVEMLAGMYRGAGKETVAWSSALLYDMIFSQPVFYEFERIETPTLLIIGQKDNTAIGKDAAPAELKQKLGQYPRLGREAARRFPHARLVEFAELGHAPQIQDPGQFHKALLEDLRTAR